MIVDLAASMPIVSKTSIVLLDVVRDPFIPILILQLRYNFRELKF